MPGEPFNVEGAAEPSEQAGEPPSEVETRQPSEIARSVSRLRSATIRAVAKRERLTQPLFWSLFTTEIAEIKRAKDRSRKLRKLLFGIE